MTLEALELPAESPRGQGQAHGETWRAEIHELAAIRTELGIQRGDCKTVEELRGLARLHLPVLHRWDPASHEELQGIADGAQLAIEDVVILNHYTDLRDVSRAWLEGDPGGCTAIYAHGPSGALLGQTWDMHSSARPFVRVLRVPATDAAPGAVCFTLTGCVGMAGLNDAGLGITINNLTCTDGRVGVVWPSLVRRLLRETRAAAAKDVLLSTPLSSGHHYMLADGVDFFGIETTGSEKMVTQIGAKATHVHTNHCFDPRLRELESISKASTTFRRMEIVSTLVAQRPPQDVDSLWALLASHEGHPRSICSHVADGGDPSVASTCGGLAMELETRRIRVGAGCLVEGETREYNA